MSQINTTFERNGASYEFDFRDADDAAKYEAAVAALKEAEKNASKDGSASEMIKQHCSMLKTFFNVCLGDDAGDAVCGKKNNISECYEAYDEFLAFVSAQKDDVLRAKNVFAKYSNREQRRAVKKTK